MDLDLRRVRYFVAVAEQLSFIRAAELLHMTQPALSRQIRALEGELSSALFERDRHGTGLTPAGRTLLDRAPALLAASSDIERRVRVAARGQTHFAIGFMPGVPVAPLIRAFAADVPRLSIEVVHTSMTEQVPFLLDGRVDVCFVRLPLPAGQFDIVPLFTEPRVAVLAPDHPLASAPLLSITDLHNEPLVDDPSLVAEWRGATPADRMAALARGAGRTRTVEESLQSVADGLGFAVLPVGIANYYARDDVVRIPLEGVAPVRVALAALPDRAMPEIRAFATLAREYLGGDGQIAELHA